MTLLVALISNTMFDTFDIIDTQNQSRCSSFCNITVCLNLTVETSTILVQFQNFFVYIRIITVICV